MEKIKARVANQRLVNQINNSVGEDAIINSLMVWKQYLAGMQQEVRLFGLESFYEVVLHSRSWSPTYKKICFTFLAQTRQEWKNSKSITV